MARVGTVHPTFVVVDEDVAQREYRDASSIAVDIETTGLKPSRDRIAVISLAAPMRPPVVLRTPGGVVPAWILRMLSRPNIAVIGHNLASFDLPFLVHAGLQLCPATTYVDTLILEALCLTSGRRDLRKDLATTVRRRLAIELDKSIDHGRWEQPELSAEQLSYAATDVSHLHALVDAQRDHLRKYSLEAAADLETRLVPVTATMVATGLPVRRAALRQAVADYQTQAKTDAADLASIGLKNPRSSQQVRQFFSARFGLELSAADAETLSVVAASHHDAAEVAQQILRTRAEFKAAMYDDAWSEAHIDDDDRVRSQYWQLGTDTGRYSSSNPNLQQIPRKMRMIIGYDSDERRLVSLDYQQIEVVVAARLFKDSALFQAVCSDDVHAFTASLMYRTSPDRILPEQRRAAKAATFTALFAGGAKGVQRSSLALGEPLSLSDAEQVLEQFFTAYPGVQDVIRRVRQQVASHKLKGLPMRIAVPGGPVRHLYPDDRLSASTVINTIIQGTAAVGLKRAMRRIWEQFPSALVATLHDEIVCDVLAVDADNVASECSRIMVDEMQKLIGLPCRTSAKIGATWS